MLAQPGSAADLSVHFYHRRRPEMSKLKSKGKSKAESVAADSALSPQGPVDLTRAEQQALDGFLDLVARLIARAHVRGTFVPPASRGAPKNTLSNRKPTDGSRHRSYS